MALQYANGHFGPRLRLVACMALALALSQCQLYAHLDGDARRNAHRRGPQNDAHSLGIELRSIAGSSATEPSKTIRDLTMDGAYPTSSENQQVPGPPETIYVDKRRVCCDGGGGALGHPKVWYDLGADGQVECLYCGRLFVYDAEKAQKA